MARLTDEEKEILQWLRTNRAEISLFLRWKRRASLIAALWPVLSAIGTAVLKYFHLLDHLLP